MSNFNLCHMNIRVCDQATIADLGRTQGTSKLGPKKVTFFPRSVRPSHIRDWFFFWQIISSGVRISWTLTLKSKVSCVSSTFFSARLVASTFSSSSHRRGGCFSGCRSLRTTRMKSCARKSMTAWISPRPLVAPEAAEVERTLAPSGPPSGSPREEAVCQTCPTWETLASRLCWATWVNNSWLNCLAAACLYSREGSEGGPETRPRTPQAGAYNRWHEYVLDIFALRTLDTYSGAPIQ